MRTFYTQIKFALLSLGLLLFASTSHSQLVVGTGTITNTSTGYPAPYGNFYFGARHQMLILASELSAGCPINQLTSLTFPIANANGSSPLLGYTIKLAHTSATSITTWQTPTFTTVFSATSYTPTTGNNTHTFSTPFTYNGTSNLIVEICFNNTGYVTNASHFQSTTAFTSCVYYRADASGVCTNTAVTSSIAQRANMIFGYSTAYDLDAAIVSMTSPVAGCSFSNAETVSVVLKNNGQNTITSLPLKYRVNGGAAVTGTFSGSLAAGATTTFSFPTTANLSSLQSASIKVVNTANDSCDAGDSLTTVVGVQMNGTYTIGGTSPDFATPTAAITALHTVGVCGPVTFNVRSGTYSGQLTLNNVSGSSATNTIKFQSDASNTTVPIITHNSGFTWIFNASRFVTIDGLRLDMTGVGGVVQLSGLTKRIAIKNSTLNGYNSTSTSTLYSIIYISTAATDYTQQFLFENNVTNFGSTIGYMYGGSTSSAVYNKGVTFKNNTFNNPYYSGIWNYYTDTATIENNQFLFAASATTQYGLYNLTANQLFFKNNTINHNTSSGTVYGVFINSGTGAFITGNKITMLNNSSGTMYGIYAFGSGTTTVQNVIANNFIAIPTAGTIRTGIYLSASYWNVYYNNVRVNNNTANTVYGPAYISGTGNVVTNNIFQNDGAGYACSFGTAFTHTYNIFRTAGSTLLNPSGTFTLGTGEYNVNPGFISTTDLHVGSFTSGYNGGTPISGYTLDIDGQTRSSSTPDIGADEYALPDYDAAIVSLDNPLTPLASGSHLVKVGFKNNGTVSMTSVYVGWKLNGTTQTAVQWTGTLAAGSTENNFSLATVTIPSGSNTIKAWTYSPNGQSDQNVSNDTMTFTFCTGMSGTYTIGGSSANYPTISAAVSALQCGGVLGAVTFNINPAFSPYNEQVSITGIAGNTSVKTITFNGQGSTISFNTTAAAPHVVMINAEKHIIINGLNIASTSTTNANTLQFSNSSDSNKIENCTISVLLANTSSLTNPVVFSNTTSPTGGGLSGQRNLFQNNTFIGGFYGVMVYGTATTGVLNSNRFENNNFQDAYLYSTYLFYAPGTEFVGNRFTRENRTTNTTYYGIFATTLSTNLLIEKNRFYNWNALGGTTSFTGYAIYNLVTSGTTTPTIIRNNAFYNLTRNTATTAAIYSTGGYTHILHNTIVIEDASFTAGTVYGVYSSSNTGTVIRNNNIVIGKSTATSYCIYLVGTGATVNNNNLFRSTTAATNHTGYYLANFTTLANWQTANTNAYDQNSTAVNPNFVSAATGVYKPANGSMNNIGASGLGVTTDILGVTRSTTAPDPGAWEFTPPVNDAGITALTGPTAPFAAGSQNVVISFKNFGSATLTSAQIGWKFNGTTQTPTNWTGSLASLATETGVSLGSVTFPVGSSTIKVWTASPNSTSDDEALNDTMIFTVCTGMSGTYTVGGSSSNYISILAAVNALQCGGVSGPVVFNINPSFSPYNEQVIISGVAGLSATKTVTFNGQGSTMTFNTNAAAPHVMKLSGVKHIKINQLNLISTSTSAGFPLMFSNSADSNTVQNCSISVNANATSTALIPVLFSNGTTYTVGGLSGSSNKIIGNVISSGYAGIWMYGTPTTGLLQNNVIQDNIIQDSYLYGIYAYVTPALTITGNELVRANRTTNTTFYGIFASTGATPISVTKNRIHNWNDLGTTTSFTGYAIYLGASGITTAQNYVTNNAIYNLTRNSATIAGIYSLAAYTNILHNTVAIEDATFNTGTNYGIYSSSNTGVYIQNNNVSCTKSLATSYDLYLSGTGAVCNNNNLWKDQTSSTSYTGFFGANFTTLANWQTANTNAYDQNSTAVDPQFVNAASGNMQPANSAMNNTGAALGITTDIVGLARSATTPDPGAWEFLNFARDAALLVANPEYYSTPRSQSANIRFTGSVANVGLDTINNVVLTMKVGAQTGTASIASILPGAAANTTLTGSNLALSSTGTYTANFYTTVTAGDQNTINDSLFNKTLVVTDSVLARDNNTLIGGIGFTAGTGYVGNIFHISTGDTVTRIGAFINGGGFGNTIRILVFNATSSGPGTTILAQSNPITLTGAAQWYYFNLCNPAPIAAGTYFAAVEQISTTNMALGRTASIYTPNRTYYGNGTTWSTIESAGLPSPVMVRAILGHPQDYNGIIASAPQYCAGSSVTLNARPGYASYAWSNAATSQTVSATTAGSYVVTVTNSFGCQYIDTAVVAANNISVSITGTTNSACGTSNGTATALAASGFGTTTYSWNTGGTSNVITGLSAGTYSVTVTDALGCTATAPAIVSNASAPNLSTTPTNIACGGTATGAIGTTVTGGTTPYTYAWSTGSTATSLSGLTAGTYSLTVTDNANCQALASVTLTQNPILNLSLASITNVLCNGLSTGAVNISVSGGVTNYSYVWSTGATTQNLSSVAAGTYTVTVTDAVSCTKTASYTITQPTALTSSITAQTNVSCFGGANGSATVTAAGGSGGNTFAWTGGGTSATKTAMTAGTYTVTVTNSNGCTVTSSATISQPSQLTSTLGTVTNVLCNGATTGSVATSQSGGTTPYGYSWTGGGSTTATRSNCAAGTYTVTVTDNLGCTVTTSGTVTQPTLIVATAAITTPLCNGDTTAALDVTTTGGTGGYSWLWSSAQTTEDVSGILAGTYTVSVTDGNSCVVPYTFTISEPGVLTYNVDNLINSFCEYGSNGQIQGSTTGGTAPYYYMWSDSSTVEDATGLAVGTYSLTLTDTNGCVFMDSIEVGFTNPAPFVEITGEDTVCAGSTVILSATSGFGTYSWSNGSIFGQNYVNTTDTYSVTVTAFNGCQNWTSFFLFVDDSITLALNASNVNCEGGSDGSIEAITTGGLNPFTYQWSDGQTTATASSLVAGSYTVIIEDAAGCSDTASVDISFDHVNPTVDLGKDTMVCFIPEFNVFNAITLDAGSFSGFAWSTGETTQSISTTGPGAYYVEVTDSNGCNAVDTIAIDSMVCLGVREQMLVSNLSVYPNPTRDITNIVIEGAQNGNYDLVIMNARGQVVMSESVKVTTGRFAAEVNLSGMAQGIYMLNVSNGKQLMTDRIVVQ